jgi:hypothetical protein
LELFPDFDLMLFQEFSEASLGTFNIIKSPDFNIEKRNMNIPHKFDNADGIIFPRF